MCLHTLYLVHNECLHLTPSPRMGLNYIPPKYCNAVRAWITAFHSQPMYTPLDVPLEPPCACPLTPEQQMAPAPPPTYSLRGISEWMDTSLPEFASALPMGQGPQLYYNSPPYTHPQLHTPAYATYTHSRESSQLSGAAAEFTPGQSYVQTQSPWSVPHLEAWSQPLAASPPNQQQTRTELVGRGSNLWHRLHFQDGTPRELRDVVAAAKLEANGVVVTALSHSQCPRCHDCQVTAWRTRGGGGAWRQIKDRHCSAVERDRVDLSHGVFWARLRGWTSKKGWPDPRGQWSDADFVGQRPTDGGDFGAMQTAERERVRQGEGVTGHRNGSAGPQTDEVGQQGQQKRGKRRKPHKHPRMRHPKQHPIFTPASTEDHHVAAAQNTKSTLHSQEPPNARTGGKTKQQHSSQLQQQAQPRVDNSLSVGKYASRAPTQYEVDRMARHLEELGFRRDSA